MIQNQLLAALADVEREQIQLQLQTVQLALGDVLFQPEQAIEHVYFPETAVVSLVNTLREGGTVEVGTVGREGMAGLPVFLTDEISSVRAVAQISGSAARLEANLFQRAAERQVGFRRLLLRYTQAFLTQVAQTAACNAAHLVDERCARWLLMTRDRVDHDHFELRHEFLAFMLGVRRAGVTAALAKLRDAGVLTTRREEVTIIDRAALEKVSCECYRSVRTHFERLLPQVDVLRHPVQEF